MTITNTSPHLMTRAELDYALFRVSGIKPVPYDAPKEEQETYMKVLEIRLTLLAQEAKRRAEAAARQVE